ncbi:MAG: tetratricopeptide repeat protein [Byssovorax sp.]
MKPSVKPPARKSSPKPTREDAATARPKPQLPADPLSMANLKSMGMRIGIPLLVLWVGAFILNGWIPKAVVGVLTLALGGLALWAVRFAKRSRAVAQIVGGADTPEARKEALAKLETDFKKDDTAAIFARAQLQMQEDPREALKTLEQVDLKKVMAPVADEARIQRAMIHLLLGETEDARNLVDNVDISRHKEAKTRATMAAIIAEAWARSGQAKKAVELLETFDPEDADYVDLRPQLLRSRAFAYAWASNTKQMKQTVRRLSQLNVQYLSGFITRKKHPMGVPPRGVHPMLEKEAFDIVSKSGAIPRQMQFKRS